MEELPAEFWIARVDKDVTWASRQENIDVIWYISTSRDQKVEGRFVPAFNDENELYKDEIDQETVIHCFSKLRDGLEGTVPIDALRLIRAA